VHELAAASLPPMFRELVQPTFKGLD